jgi:membrane protein DedA with SNARE-associated domain
MSETIHALIEQYGLVAVFAGCLFEGETAAILGGFFGHQGVFVPWQAFAAASAGAFLGDASFFLAGRRFAEHRLVRRLRKKPGFSHAYELVRAHPNLFVLTNRYVYGMRLLGGVVAGLSDIPPLRFLLLNALSSLSWAALFTGLGYFFGLGAEQLLGETLHKHHRLLIALGIGVVVLLLGHFAARRLSRRRKDGEPADGA